MTPQPLDVTPITKYSDIKREAKQARLLQKKQQEELLLA